MMSLQSGSVSSSPRNLTISEGMPSGPRALVASRNSSRVDGMPMDIFSGCCGMVWMVSFSPSIRGPGAAQSVSARSITFVACMSLLPTKPWIT